MKIQTLVMAACVIALPACSPGDNAEPALFEALSAHCGQSYAGSVDSDDPLDADWVSQRLVIEFRECSDDTIRIPLHVGDDHSRTWVISRTDDGLRLKHDHRHEDGSEDVLTQYGGDTIGPVTGMRAEFPADDFSRDLFVREGIPVSADNVWSFTLTDTSLTYALDRPNRHFEAVFDLTETVDAPPPPWGAEE